MKKLTIKNKTSFYALVFGLAFGLVYILLDDNNLVPKIVETATYSLAWAGIFSSALLHFYPKYKK